MRAGASGTGRRHGGGPLFLLRRACEGQVTAYSYSLLDNVSTMACGVLLIRHLRRLAGLKLR